VRQNILIYGIYRFWLTPSVGQTTYCSAYYVLTWLSSGISHHFCFYISGKRNWWPTNHTARTEYLAPRTLLNREWRNFKMIHSHIITSRAQSGRSKSFTSVNTSSVSVRKQRHNDMIYLLTAIG
jgi:hypothetical protein